jgi:antitoxin VapB
MAYADGKDVNMAERRDKPTRRRRAPARSGCLAYEQPETKAHGLEESARPFVGPAATEAERLVRLFKNGRSQAVRIPREFELPGKEAIMRKDGDRLIIEPAKPRSLLGLLATLEPLDEGMPPIADQLPEPVDL